MNRKIVWSLAGFMTVLALVLASCAPATTPTPTPTTTPTPTPTGTTTPLPTPARELVRNSLGKLVEKPQYGGTFTFFLGHAQASDYFDPVISNIGGWLYSINYDYLIEADWLKSPQGTGENEMIGYFTSPDHYTGLLLEKWEVIDPYTAKFYLKKGIRFQDKAPVSGRELTADDVIYSVRRGQTDPRNSFYWSASGRDTWLKTYETYPGFKEFMAAAEKEVKAEYDQWKIPFPTGSYVTKLDKYTLLRRGLTPTFAPFLGYAGVPIYAREAVALPGGLADWRNHVSTGPWMVIDSVGQSSVTWKKNPNYFMSDPLFPENKLPYFDKMVGLMVVDLQTRLAAIRTNKIDLMGIPWDKVDGFKETNPQFKWRTVAPSGTYIVFMRTDIAPFSDLRVRQALNYAVNRKEMVDLYFKGKAQMITWPVIPGLPEFITFEQMPANIQKMWGGFPGAVEEAKKLLAEAGYPNGFKTTLGSYTDPYVIDLNTMVKEYLAKIGVEVTYTNYEGATHDSILYSRKYPGLHFTWWGNAGPWYAWSGASGGSPTSISNFSNVVDSVAEQEYIRYWGILDAKERVELVKKMSLRILEQGWTIPLPIPSGYIAWQPWVKGYSGEACVGPGSEPGLGGRNKFMWIDQELKQAFFGK